MQAMHNFDAESEKELSLAVGDYVVVRKVFVFLMYSFDGTRFSYLLPR